MSLNCSRSKEKQVKCPFNPNHVVWEKSLQRHIIRCMVNYPNYVTCPYNALHRFANTQLLGEHMFECESRVKAHLFLEVNEPQRDHEDQLVHIDNIREFNLKFEDWDKK